MLQRVGCRRPPKVRLRPDQRLACDFAIALPRAGLFLPIGAGKTLTTLELIWELGMDETTNVLVIGPKTIMRSTWQDEMSKWGFPFDVGSFLVNERGTKRTKASRHDAYARAAQAHHGLWFTTRDLIVDLVSWHVDNKVAWPYGMVVIDEAQSFKSPSSKRFKALRTVSPGIERLVELTGTPAPNGLLDVWSLMWLLDGGARLGRSMTAYRTTYFHATKVLPTGVPIGWEPNYGADKVIRQRMAEVCVTFETVRDYMPPVTYDDVRVRLSKAELAEYNTMAKEQVVSFLDTTGEMGQTIALNEGVVRARLRQMASGTSYSLETYVGVRGTMRSRPRKDANGDPIYGIIHKHKIDALRTIVEEAGSPVLVAYFFKCEALLLHDELSDLGCEVFDGSPDMIRRWNAREIPVMLIQPASAGFGLNLQDGGHTLVWYTLPESLEQYEQTNGRLARSGQRDPVIIHHLIAVGTVDNAVSANLGQKADVQDGVMRALRFDESIRDYYRSLV